MKKTRDFFIDLIKNLIVSLLIVMVLFRFVFMAVAVEGNSMYPVLKSGDMGLSFIITKNVSIKRFDIAVVEDENLPNKIVKRIIGLPNETIAYRDNQLFIDNEPLSEAYLSNNAFTEDFVFTLGQDEYFVMGDNRNISKDSRSFGPFKAEQIVATHIMVFWPLEDFGWK